MRDEIEFLDMWYTQIKHFCSMFSAIDFYLSVYENDSIDGTVKKVQTFDYGFLKASHITSEVTDKKSYKERKEDDAKSRIADLANARNQALFHHRFDISDFSKVIFIEADIHYDKSSAVLMNYDFDIVSGLSVLAWDNLAIYDTWATRITDKETRCSNPNFFKGLVPVWSTFNGFCIYKMEPFLKGARFGNYNERLGIYDCDCAVICEEFRKMGYDKIFIDSNYKVIHLGVL